MRRDVLFDKYKNILIDIITNYNNTKTEKCIELLLENQRKLLDDMSHGNFNGKNDVNTIITVIMSIDKGLLETDINKYIAPYFNISKGN